MYICFAFSLLFVLSATVASLQAMENCKLLERAINEGDFNTAVDTVRELIGARIDVTVRPQDTRYM